MKLDTWEKPLLKTQPKPALNTVGSLNSSDFAEVEHLVRVWPEAWGLPSGHIYHDHLLKYARIALGTSLQDHFDRQKTRGPTYDVIMHSQALQENSFSEVRFRALWLFLNALSLLAFHFPWNAASCTWLKRKMLYLREVHRYDTAIGQCNLFTDSGIFFLSGISSNPHTVLSAAFYIWIFNLAEPCIKTCVAPKLPVDHREKTVQEYQLSLSTVIYTC